MNYVAPHTRVRSTADLEDTVVYFYCLEDRG